MKIYLAGPVAEFLLLDWRRPILKRMYTTYFTGDGCITALDKWPIVENAINGGHSYTGPFFGRTGHDCPSFHGTDDSMEMVWNVLSKNCRDAICMADMVFAWIPNTTCYGTIAELGYAKAMGKKIVMAVPEIFPELSFTISFCSTGTLILSDKNPTEKKLPAGMTVDGYRASKALHQFLERNSIGDSPIEKMFYEELRRCTQIKCIPQHQISSYRVDFAFPTKKLVVELDGHEWHSSKEQRTRDAKRDRDLDELGWKVLRFTGTEIYKDVASCVKEVLKRVTT